MTTPEIRWPKNLQSAASANDLAIALYQARCRFYNTPELPWEDVEYHIRAGIFELSVRVLRHLGIPLSEVVDGQIDSLFDFATELARSEAQRLTSRKS